MLEIEPLPPEEMQAVVLSATQNHILLSLPAWSTTQALYIRREEGCWPGRHVTAPAVNVHYLCDVDFNGDAPTVVCWRAVPDESESQVPTPHAAPLGLPGPPDLLPVLDGAALYRTIDGNLGKLTKGQRDGVAYLIRRAYGQGTLEARRA